MPFLFEHLAPRSALLRQPAGGDARRHARVANEMPTKGVSSRRVRAAVPVPHRLDARAALGALPGSAELTVSGARRSLARPGGADTAWRQGPTGLRKSAQCDTAHEGHNVRFIKLRRSLLPVPGDGCCCCVRSR
jgi:hypothetical protein